MKEWKGRELSEDLASYLQSANWMTWTNIPLGSVQNSPGVQIADVLAVPKSFTKPIFKIYEIKVSRADFFGDVGREKYKGYFKSAHYVLFAVPQGLIKAAELPQDGVGLIVRTEDSWHVVKSGRRSDFQIGIELLLKLLMRGYQDHFIEYRSKKRREEGAKQYTDLNQAFYDYGIHVAHDIAHAQKFLKTADALLKEMGPIMGRDYSSLGEGVLALQQDIEKLMRQKKHYRLAVPLAEYAMKLFNGDYLYHDPVKELEQLLALAKEDFGEKPPALTKSLS